MYLKNADLKHDFKAEVFITTIEYSGLKKQKVTTTDSKDY